jgi:hypothetical protein
MYFGPLILQRFGRWARRAYWLFTILLMIVIGNLGLYGFRTYLSSQSGIDDTLLLELWFSAMALTVGLGLIFRKLLRNPASR